MEFDEDHRDESRLWDHTFLKQSLINPIRSIRQLLTRRGEKFFEEKYMIMVYLRRERIPT